VAKRGRPRTHGEKPGRMFFRDAFVRCAFDEARRNGEKYNDAISAAVSALNSGQTKRYVSRTEVKRILAARRLEPPGQTLLVTKDVLESSEVATANAHLPGVHITRLPRWTLQFGPCPDHPRNNARTDRSS
jgi:hypothetical protein